MRFTWHKITYNDSNIPIVHLKHPENDNGTVKANILTERIAGNLIDLFRSHSDRT